MSLSAEEKIRRGRRAQELLRDEVLSYAFLMAEELQKEEWVDSDDPQVRERCWAVVRGIREVQRMLRSIGDDGEVTASRQ